MWSKTKTNLSSTNDKYKHNTHLLGQQRTLPMHTHHAHWAEIPHNNSKRHPVHHSIVGDQNLTAHHKHTYTCQPISYWLSLTRPLNKHKHVAFDTNLPMWLLFVYSYQWVTHTHAHVLEVLIAEEEKEEERWHNQPPMDHLWQCVEQCDAMWDNVMWCKEMKNGRHQQALIHESQ